VSAKRRVSPRDAQLGLGLIEILIAIAISMFLLAGVLQVFLSGKQAYRLLETNARLQEGGRFSAQFLTGDVRMAGYLGCFHNDFTTAENRLNTPTDFKWNLSVPIEGYEASGAGWSPGLPAAISGDVKTGSDVIVVRGLAEDGIRLIDPYPDSTAGTEKFYVNAAGANIQSGDIVMATNCNRASIFQVTNETAVGAKLKLSHATTGSFTPGNGAAVSNSFTADTELARLVTHVYYVGTGASGEPALIRKELTANGVLDTQEMAEGVEDLQVLYGEDLTGDGLANRYVTANQVTDFSQVVSVRISLLVRSDEKMASQPQPYYFKGATVTPTDLRVRRVFTTTIKLRNRGVL
jgi:type IV pilus assembly protein PilW